MALPTGGQMPATDGSDIVVIQPGTNSDNGSTSISLRGYQIDQGAYVANLKVINTNVGSFTGNH